MHWNSQTMKMKKIFEAVIPVTLMSFEVKTKLNQRYDSKTSFPEHFHLSQCEDIGPAAQFTAVGTGNVIMASLNLVEISTSAQKICEIVEEKTYLHIHIFDHELIQGIQRSVSHWLREVN